MREALKVNCIQGYAEGYAHSPEIAVLDDITQIIDLHSTSGRASHFRPLTDFGLRGLSNGAGRGAAASETRSDHSSEDRDNLLWQWESGRIDRRAEALMSCMSPRDCLSML